MWERLLEASSVLPTLKQNIPSNRSDVSGTQGVGDRSEIGKKPWEGQAKLLGNLNGQSRGMEGTLDTQGKSSPELFTSRKGNTKDNNPGTFTPATYKKMYDQKIQESANATETGTQAGKHKTTGVAPTAGLSDKYVPGGDTNNGGSCNCGKSEKRSTLTEAQFFGSTIALVAARALIENA